MTWSHPHDAGSYLALVLGLTGLLLLARRFAAAPGARNGALVLLRASALAVLVLILLNPVQIAEVRRPAPEPTAVYLIDGSRSMGLEAPISRAEEAASIMAQAEGSLPSARRPRIERYRFGRQLAALPAAERTARPEEDETRLVSALESLPARFGDAPPLGVFVVSDGRSTEPDGIDAVARGYKELRVPIHVVPVGDPRIVGDVAVQDLVAPRDAPPGTRVPIRVVVRSRGYVGHRVEVRVLPADTPGGKPLASLPVTLADGEQAHELVLETDRAKGPLRVEVPLRAGEAIAENNAVSFQIARRDPQLRVLYMEGTTGAEYRWIRDALVEDPDIECTALEVNNQYVQRPTLHRADDPSRGFPTSRAELFAYDVVICSDIARAAFTPEQLAWTAELVGDRGGGFVMIGGYTSFGSGGWDQTAWDALIPVDMSGRRSPTGEQFYNGDFRVVVPPEAQGHPVWRLVDDPGRNRQVLARMPAFHGTNLTDRLKPAATVLGLTDRPLPVAGIIPIFSCQSYGRGRSFAMATDSTQTWGADFERSWGEGDNRYFRRFWRNVIRWLAENSAGAHRRLRVETDRVVYRPGQTVQVTARAYDEQLEETDRYRIVAHLRRPGAGRQALPAAAGVTLSPRTDQRLVSGELTVPAAQEIIAAPSPVVQALVLDITAYEGDRVAAHASLDLQVLDDPAEFQDPRPDPAVLMALARLSGGEVVRDPGHLARLLSRHGDAPDRVVIARAPLWDHALVWTLLLGLLSAEWIARRRRGLA